MRDGSADSPPGDAPPPTARAAELAARLRADELAPGYVRPAYADYCFANVPATAADVLGADLGRTLPGDALRDVETDGVSTVVVLLVDGFGWAQFGRDAGDHPVFSRLADRATLTPLTGIYPTETAACVTTVHTGAPTAQHAVLGWDQYLPPRDAYVETLPYRVLDGPALDEAFEGFEPGELVRADPIYPELADHGVAATAIQPENTLVTPYSTYTTAGAETRGYDGTPEDLAREIRRACEAGGPRYVYAYYPDVDAAAHYAGTESAAHREALAGLDSALETELLAKLDDETAAETLLLATADHGEVDTDPETNVDLWEFPGVRQRLARRPGGDPIPPVGGPRNVHLHVRDGEREALAADLERELDALVLSRDEYLEAGLFGDVEPSDAFARRAGDLLVVPNERSVWWGGAPALEFVGMHGGLHPREAIVPLAACRLSVLA